MLCHINVESCLNRVIRQETKNRTLATSQQYYGIGKLFFVSTQPQHSIECLK